MGTHQGFGTAAGNAGGELQSAALCSIGALLARFTGGRLGHGKPTLAVAVSSDAPRRRLAVGALEITECTGAAFDVVVAVIANLFQGCGRPFVQNFGRAQYVFDSRARAPRCRGS
jgi:hypothetical protein